MRGRGQQEKHGQRPCQRPSPPHETKRYTGLGTPPRIGWRRGTRRCQSSGATSIACTSRAARSGSACARRAPRSRSAPSAIRAELERRGRALHRRRAAGRRRSARAFTTRSSRTTSRARGTTGTRPGCRPTRGRTASSPTSSPHPSLFSGFAPTAATAPTARAGQFAYDTMTLIGPGTWEAARAALDTAVTAADLVLDGERGRLRLLPPARPPRDALGLRRLLLPQQLRRRGSPAARGTGRARGGDRHRRPPRQRHAGDLLGRHRGAHRLRARRSGRGLVPALPRLRERDRARRRRTATCRSRPAPATRPGWRPWPSSRTGRASAAPSALVVALGVDAAGGRPGEPARR